MEQSVCSAEQGERKVAVAPVGSRMQVAVEVTVLNHRRHVTGDICHSAFYVRNFLTASTVQHLSCTGTKVLVTHPIVLCDVMRAFIVSAGSCDGGGKV